MAEPVPVEVLRFIDVDVEHTSAWGPGVHSSRQVAIGGVTLGDYLATRVGHPVAQSTPIVDDRSGAATPQGYLRALLGGPKEEPLRTGRIALGYCDACLDSSCGVLLAATLSIEGTTVFWSEIGFEKEDQGPAPKLVPFWKKAPEPEPLPADHEWWTPDPFSPVVTIAFDRDQYLEAVQAERRRVGTAS